MTEQDELKQAVQVLRSGGVIAYPTEYCFGLGCDPKNEVAVQRILSIKQRSADQGLLMVALDLTQVKYYANLDNVLNQDNIIASWPGPITWLLPKKSTAPSWICGAHNLVGLRVSDFLFLQKLCLAFGGAIVSTSANRHGQAEHLSAQHVIADMGEEVDFVVDKAVQGRSRASTICNSLTGETIR